MPKSKYLHTKIIILISISVLGLAWVILLNGFTASPSADYAIHPFKYANHTYCYRNEPKEKIINSNYIAQYIKNSSNATPLIIKKDGWFNFYVSHNANKNISRTLCVSNTSEKKAVVWDYVLSCTEHGFNGTLLVTEKYGKYNLTPYYDAAKGPSDELYPALLPAALSMYKITHNKTYLDYARSTADAIEKYMLNDKNIIRTYSRTKGPSDTEPTDSNYYLLTSIAELAIHDPSYRHLAQRVADGIISNGLSKYDIPYGSIYPNGTAAETKDCYPSNGSLGGPFSITVVGLLRTYEATGNTICLNKSHDILLSIWKNEKTKFNLIPRIFDSSTLNVNASDTQLYATGEMLRAYVYYYYLTHDQTIKNIISAYSAAAYNSYWAKTTDGDGYFVYRVDAFKGLPSSLVLETNWHKLDMSLIYAGEILNKDYTDRVYQDMNTSWLGDGLSYKNHMFRHGTLPNGCPAHNRQSLIYASMRTANYVMLRMFNSRAFNPSNSTWNDKIWDHINCTQFYHYHQYGYYSDVSIETLKPDPNYYGLSIIPACGEFASLVTLMFNTTPNVKMIWESFPQGDYVLEPFPTDYSADYIGFMRGVFMDYLHKEIAFKNIISQGEGKVYCSQPVAEVRKDGQIYTNWVNNEINTSNGSHEYIIILKGGNYIKPIYS